MGGRNGQQEKGLIGRSMSPVFITDGEGWSDEALEEMLRIVDKQYDAWGHYSKTGNLKK